VVSNDLHALILDSISEGVFTVDADFRITSFNTEAERIIGVSRGEAIGRRCHEIFRASICSSSCALRQTVKDGTPRRNVRIDVLNPRMEPVPICVSTAVLKDRKGRLIGGVEIFRDISEVESLRRELSGNRVFADMVGASKPMQELFALLPDVAASDAPVLIQGPSGSGKELVARAIHDLSPRARHPLVLVNCAALPDTLLESELFGHVRGAFTDARDNRIGRFQSAHKGVLFLDEIGEISPAFQAKLLRVLESGELSPLGSDRVQHVDVRVISATNRDLQEQVRRGRFREDLFYRLRVVPITLPPLRERRSDIPLLVDHLLAKLRVRTGKPIQRLSAAAIAVLYDHDFPGNVRELQNLLERAFVLCHGEVIDLDHLPREVFSIRGGPGEKRLKPSERKIASHRSPAKAQEPAPEVQQLLEALEAHHWNRTETARALGIGRNTLWRRMREHGLR
jgi:PAS domain S-box-containing protein